MKTKHFALALAGLSLVLSACHKDDHDHDHDHDHGAGEEELITTVNFNLKNESTGEMVEMTMRDLDGEGGDDPVISVSGPLSASTSYSSNVVFLNEDANPVEDVTTEIREEGIYHQIFVSSTVEGVAYQYKDKDENGKPIGLEGELNTGAAGSGKLTLTLLHEPDKDAAGVSEGKKANAGGSTDVQVTFPITVK